MTCHQKGRRLTSEQAQKLEEQLKVNPKDLSLRAHLLSYYNSKSYRSEDARKARYSHVLWIIEHHPGAAIAGRPEAILNPVFDKENYQEAKALWLKQVDKHKDSATVLSNAASFCFHHDKERAESLLSKARTLEPNNPQWSQQLGQLYRLQGAVAIQRSAEKRKEFSAKAVKQFEDALKATKTEIERSALLHYVAVTALDAGQLKKAEVHAVEMLTKAQTTSHKSGFLYGNAVHHGNLILGRLALASGNLAKAKKHLIEAGKTPGSPQLNSFGPNMTLAKELLEKGDKEIVLEYFQLCSKFWKMKRDRLKQWTDDVRPTWSPSAMDPTISKC